MLCYHDAFLVLETPPHWAEVLHTASRTTCCRSRPGLPTLVPEPPAGEGWIQEIKYDGNRTLVAIDRGQVRAFTRNGFDWPRPIGSQLRPAPSSPAKPP